MSVWALVAAAGCSAVSKQMRLEAEPRVSFAELVQEPDRYIGRTVILGGTIIETDNKVDHTRILVLQTPLDMRDEPSSTDRSFGRFLIVHKGYLEPEIYKKGRKITVAGVVTGAEKARVGEREMLYPRIEDEELVLWPETEPGDLWYYPYPFLYPPYWYYPYYPYYW